MSFDLIVFVPEGLPITKHEFLAWYKKVRATENDFRFPDSEGCVEKLREYFKELTSYFPWREKSLDDEVETEYEFAKVMLRCSFAWREEAKADDTILALCWRLKMGVYYVGTTGEILFPEQIWDVMNLKSRKKRPWWKIWRP